MQTPLRARRDLQQRLSSLQEAPTLRLALVMGTALGLPLLWWLDRSAAMASRFSPIGGSPRLVALLLAATLAAPAATTETGRPLLQAAATRSISSGRRAAGNTAVVTGLRPGGRSSITDTSRSA